MIKEIKSRVNVGITMLELALVIIIVGILASAAVPVMFNMYDDADAETVRSIVADIEMAMSEGISRGVPYAQLTSPGGGATQFLDNIVAMVGTGFPNNVTIVAPGVSQVSVTITATGGPPKTAQLTIQTNGNVSITAISGFTGYNIVGGDLVKI